VISEYLLAILLAERSSETDVEVILQATSALIDIYSDEDQPYDTNFRQSQYLQKLSSAVDLVKKTVKSIDRRKPGGRALRLRGEEVYENLVAFIRYRNNLKLQ
jgi:hypothetical protein